MAEKQTGNSFDDLAYQHVRELIDFHDDEFVSLKVERDKLLEMLADERFGQESLIESLNELRMMTRAFMKDLVHLAFTEQPELLRGKIYALVSSFPQGYKKITEKIPSEKDVPFRDLNLLEMLSILKFKKEEKD